MDMSEPMEGIDQTDHINMKLCNTATIDLSNEYLQTV